MDGSRVRKVTAVCLREHDGRLEVLVFDHSGDDGGVMVQLPAGTIEADEEPDAAVLRELVEETGVQATAAGLVGVLDEEWDGQSRRRWVFIVQAPAGLGDEWPYHCDCGTETRCHWLPLTGATIYGPQQPWLEMAKRHVNIQTKVT